jgi:hypothetical protein
VKERRKGPIGRAAGIAEGLAATVRRMQREREPRVLVYDETGYARLVQPDGRGYERLLDTAEQMVALVDEAEVDPKPRRARAAEGKTRRVAGAGEGEGKASRVAATGDGEGKTRGVKARRSKAEARTAGEPKTRAAKGRAGKARGAAASAEGDARTSKARKAKPRTAAARKSEAAAKPRRRRPRKPPPEGEA